MLVKCEECIMIRIQRRNAPFVLSCWLLALGPLSMASVWGLTRWNLNTGSRPPSFTRHAFINLQSITLIHFTFTVVQNSVIFTKKESDYQEVLITSMLALLRLSLLCSPPPNELGCLKLCTREHG